MIADGSEEELTLSARAAYGNGCVAVVGPHPEPDPSWHADSPLTNSDGIQADRRHDLIDRMLTR